MACGSDDQMKPYSTSPRYRGMPIKSHRANGTDSGPGADPYSPESLTSTNAHVDPEETDFARLQGQWEKHMKNLSPKKRHLKVEVLLLYWEKRHPSYLDTDKEVDDLEEVFTNSYNYNVHRCVLNHPDHPNAMLWINSQLAGFVEKHDSDNSLLIIYYAGHGIPNEAGGLSLRGGNTSSKSQKNKTDEIAWSKTQGIIDCAERADFLLIFDCCFAGKLAGFASRKDFSKTNFDFLGASAAQQLAEVPGEKSFTFAMIRALRLLASEIEGFTTSELFNKILECPTFPKEEQTPCIISKKNCVERLLLAPLPRAEAQLTAAPLATESIESHIPQYCLRLDFLFTELPIEEEMTELCEGFKGLIHEKRLSARKIVWNSLHREQAVPLAAKAAAHRWMYETYRRKSRHSSSGDHKKILDTINGSTAEFPELERTESPLDQSAAPNQEQVQEMGRSRRKRRRL